MYCFIKPYDQNEANLVVSVISATLLALGIFVFVRSRKLKKEITTPDLNTDFEETYCSVTLQIVKYT